MITFILDIKRCLKSMFLSPWSQNPQLCLMASQLKLVYHKLKIKDIPDGTSPGQLCVVELTKITSDKMSGSFVEFDEENVNEDIAAKERHFAQIYASV